MKIRIEVVSLYEGVIAATAVRATVLDSNGAVVVTTDATSASVELDGVAEGSYTAQAQLLDGTSKPFGALMSVPFSAQAGQVNQTVFGEGINAVVLG